MTGQQILWAFLALSLLIGLVVLGDVLRYRDLQRRLKAEREKANHDEDSASPDPREMASI